MICCIFITYCYQRLKYTVANALLIVHKCWLIHNIIDEQILMPDSHITDPHTQTCVHHTRKQCSLDRHEDKLLNLSNIFFNEVK